MTPTLPAQGEAGKLPKTWQPHGWCSGFDPKKQVCKRQKCLCNRKDKQP